MRLQTTFMETLLSCRWGAFIQAEQVSGTTDTAQVFASSAGDVVVDYTTQWHENQWKQSLLLNGVVEVKDLVSWPQDMMFDEAESLVTLPPSYASDGEQSVQPALNHIRHTIRILLNQHQIPADILVAGEEGVLFTLTGNRSWQFLAVVEHQLIDVLPDADCSTVTLRHDRRWTALQEVRFILPSMFKSFLLSQQTEQHRTLDPVDGIDEIGEANQGYLGTGLRSALAAGESPELDKLLSPVLLVVYPTTADNSNTPKSGKMPLSQHLLEGATPWCHTILSISWSCLHSFGSLSSYTSPSPSARCQLQPRPLSLGPSSPNATAQTGPNPSRA